MITGNEFDRLFSSEKQMLVLSLDSLVSKKKDIQQTLLDINFHLDVFKNYFLIVKIGSNLYNLCGKTVIELAQKYCYEIMIEASYFSSHEDIRMHFFNYVELGANIILLDAKYNQEELHYIKSYVEDIAFSFGIRAPILIFKSMNEHRVLESSVLAENAEIDGVMMSIGELNSIIYEGLNLSEEIKYAVIIDLGDNLSKEMLQLNKAIENGASLIILSGEPLFSEDKVYQEELARKICAHAKMAEEVIKELKCF